MHDRLGTYSVSKQASERCVSRIGWHGLDSAFRPHLTSPHLQELHVFQSIGKTTVSQVSPWIPWGSLGMLPAVLVQTGTDMGWKERSAGTNRLICGKARNSKA